MNNLFIMHTQYNLILASGILKFKYSKDTNILILFAEFELNNLLKGNLEQVFDQVIIVSDNFIVNDKWRIMREKAYYAAFLKTKELWKTKFDRVFISQDRKFETALLTRLEKANKFSLYSIEEDCYYSLESGLNGKTATSYRKEKLQKRPLLIKIGSLFIRGYHFWKYGIDTYIDSKAYCYGMNKKINYIYALYPEMLRPELSSKCGLEINSYMLNEGIANLYGRKKEVSGREKNILFFFDLIERYHNLEKIKEIVKYLILFCEARKIPFFCKFHPRETRGFDILLNHNVYEINKIIPSEKILEDFFETDTIVIGNTTTAIMVAKKLGFDVFSIAPIEGYENHYLLEFYQKIGIELIENQNKIIKLLQQKFGEE